VVWWDPHALHIGAALSPGLRYQHILEEGEQGERVQERHSSWKAERLATLDAAAKPTRVTKTVTQASLSRSSTPVHGVKVSIERTDAWREERPVGHRFGTLVHAVLAEIDLGAGEEGIEALVHVKAGMIGAPTEERAAAMDAVRAALAHSVITRARDAAGQVAYDVRREVQVIAHKADGMLVEGFVDLAFREAGRWIVVDFKTGADDIEANLPRYEEQVRLYAGAVADATGEEASPVLLLV
jgi:ATP-dependent exoDNAse (exonuclease V) beta subunit